MRMDLWKPLEIGNDQCARRPVGPLDLWVRKLASEWQVASTLTPEKKDIGRVMKVLTEVADRNPYCLDEPAPIIVFKGFGDSALEFLFGVWFAKQDYVTLRNTIMREIKERFDAEGIEIPFPHRTLYAGAATEPFPVRVVAQDGAP